MLCNPTIPELRTIKEALLSIMQGGPIDACLGICHNVDMQLTAYHLIDCYPILRDLVQKWPNVVLDHCGEADPYFIPDTEEDENQQGWHWIGEQGDLRMQAMQFMVAEIDRRLAAPAALTA